jgi:predicted N-acyltransferase
LDVASTKKQLRLLFFAFNNAGKNFSAAHCSEQIECPYMNAPVLKIIENLADIPAAQWDALAENDPFLSYAYLNALQQSGCATAQFGWRAQFITLWQGSELLGAMPLYLKMNSYGEHVFDFAWANAYQQHGLRYYPKLVCTVPFTPVTGARLLTASGPDANEMRALLLSSALQFAKESGVSSLHCLFTDETDIRLMQQQSMMLRQDVQFHWQNEVHLQNRGYRDFEEYLAALSRDKRKRIKQERRKIKESGIKLQCITGENATPEQWAFFAACYAHTREQHHSPPRAECGFFPAPWRHFAATHITGYRDTRGSADRERAEYFHQRCVVWALMGCVRISPRLAFRDVLLPGDRVLHCAQHKNFRRWRSRRT